MSIQVGTILYGYCGGIFGRDSYGQKRVEAIGADWIVARTEAGRPEFAQCSSDDLERYTVNEMSEELEQAHYAIYCPRHDKKSCTCSVRYLLVLPVISQELRHEAKKELSLEPLSEDLVAKLEEAQHPLYCATHERKICDCSLNYTSRAKR